MGKNLTPARFERFPVREFVLLPLSVALYALVLHWVYVNLVTESFAYLGYRYESPVAQMVFITWALAVAVAVLLPRRITRPSGLILWVLFVVCVGPSILMSTYVALLDPWTAIAVSAAIAAAFAGVVLWTRRPVRSLPSRLAVSGTTFWILLGLFSLLTYGLLAFTSGLSLRYVSLLEVYSVRDEYSTALAGAGGLLGYVVSTQANVINPVIIARGIYSRRPLPIILGVVGQLVIYSGTGFKTVLFSLPAVLLLALLFRRNLRPAGQMFLWGTIALMVVAAAVDELQDTNLWTSLFSRRFLFTPGLFSSAYVAFFSENPKVHLGHSILSPWFDNPYFAAPPRVIGQWLIGSADTAANANLFADGFANFGWWGVAGAAVVLAVYLRLLDRAAHALPAAVSAIVVFMPTVALSNSAILTAMLSHGLVVAFGVLAVAPRTGWGLQPKKDPLARRILVRADVPAGTRDARLSAPPTAP